MGRFGEAHELMGGILFLMDENYASFINGVVLPIDGGFLCLQRCIGKIMTTFIPKHKFIVCIDSDGCAMDTMNIKHDKCFGPYAVEIFWTYR